LGELIEENPKWRRFAVALVDKADELVEEIHYILNNKGYDRVMDFTRQEKTYLRQVIKQLKKIKNRYQVLDLA
jgi:transcription initiation factor TFIIIB Brf1 subunit/transcription initiation factor TFIIB